MAQLPARSRPAARRFGARTIAFLGVLACAHSPALAQQGGSSNLGLAGVGALGFRVGLPRVEATSSAVELGALVDLGWVGTPRLRLQGEASFLRAALTEYVPVEDRTYEGQFFDLTGSVSAVLMGGGAASGLAPYLVTGLGVHALSSAIDRGTIDQRYNQNPFGSHVGAGLRWWVSRGGRGVLDVEVRRTIAEAVNRTSVRAGWLVTFNDLVRKR